MKKSILIILLLSLFLLTGCDLINQMMCEHEYEVLEEKSPTCKEDGFMKTKCIKCEYENEEILSKLLHQYTEWTTIKEATTKEDGIKKRECIRCGEVEEVIIYSDSYIYMDVIRFDFKENQVYTINSYEDLSILFNACLLNQVSIMKCIVNYDITDFNELLNNLVNDSKIAISFEVSASLRGNELEITITYEDIATKTTTNYVYEQYSSSNYSEYKSSRDLSYDNFKINNSKYSYKVSTSEQLYYVLERKVKPVCEEGSVAYTLYNKMKEVLRQIIDDSMTDYEKIKAIYDYLILNVTYDDELLKLTSKSQNVKEYNGFYLEGVFLDKKAVCEGIAKSLSCLANIEGIPCVVVEGYQTNNPKGLGHAWNKVCINDIWYIIDATSGGTIVNDDFEILSYQFFLIDEKTMNKKYTGTTYNELHCNINYDYYVNNSFTVDNQVCDYIINSQSELTQIIKYYTSFDKTNNTIEFKVTFDFGKSIDDEIQKAHNELKLSGQFSYVQNDNIIVLVK